MTCDAIQRSISMELDGEEAPESVERHVEGCSECRDFRRLAELAAATYRDRVELSQRTLRGLDRPPVLRRRRPWVALAAAAALLIAAWTWRPSTPPAAPPVPARLLVIDIPDLPASLRNEPELDLLAVARDLPLRLGDLWPAEDVALPRSVAE